MGTYTKQFIAGNWEEGSSNSVIKNVNPYTNDIINEIKGASKEDLNRAYEASKDAQKAWEDKLPGEKREVMEKAAQIFVERKEDVIDWLIKESGSTRVKAEIEWGGTVNTLKEASSFPYRMTGSILPSNVPGKENRIYRSAKGVVTVICPWNFPLILTMRSVAPALATGNSVLLKPASATPVTSGFLIAEIFEQAGLPKGVLSVIVGKGSEIGDDIVEHPIPKLVSFTGSTEVGRRIGEIAGRTLKDVALELGGNNVLIVLNDADLDRAAEAAAFGAYLHQGQICMSLNRVVVDANVYDKFVGKFKDKVSQLKAGDPADPETAVGPLINSSEVERIQKEIETSKAKGAKVVIGGQAEGNVLHPTILSDVTNDMPVAQNEMFGPVSSVIKAEDEQDAIRIANDSPYGLSGAVFSKDLNHGVKVAKQIETGMIHVNDQSVNEEAHVAFGGEKGSGVGRFGGEWAIEKFTTVKWISVQEDDRFYPFFKQK
ncbi:aldehyde dehydrogenase (NAD+) [Oceanobacillus limi]|uniref:Salicylaldehyde dehydrogenase n=1 Tax=Oceanobacillus limi TaxID=930131 RepID=A0A1I0GRG2_9BACI|nr:aldehyde dehydrogenase family protein [Oceanobacillus limi]SET73703.1 aldehyde dehydrogenase (NAD+) [Oceanobacillus limi]